MASAQSSSSSGNSLVDKIASTFNLNKADVQKVFDEDRQQHEADREAKIKERLQQAVTDGKLTQTQANALESKLSELKDYMETLKDKTEDERRAAMKAKFAELQQWFKDNNIPQEFQRMGMHGPRGMGGPGPDDAPPADSSSSNTN